MRPYRLFCLATVVIMLLLGAYQLAAARDVDGRFAGSPLKSWFDSLRSGKGPCCSDADGSALSDVDWEAPGQTNNKTTHYRVRIEGKWFEVPDDAVITEPNRAGKAMVWPVYLRGPTQEFMVNIRCFMPGSMT